MWASKCAIVNRPKARRLEMFVNRNYYLIKDYSFSFASCESAQSYATFVDALVYPTQSSFPGAVFVCSFHRGET
jgi:hypothetical protein